MYKKTFIYIMLLCVASYLGSCKKSVTYDERPYGGVSAKIVFTPEDIGTTGTNQTDTLCAGVSSLYIQGVGNDSAVATVYFDIDGKIYVPANPPYSAESYADVIYYVTLVTPNFKKSNLQTGQLYWSSTTSKADDPTLCTIGYYWAGERHDNVWQAIKKGSDINFSSFSDCYIRFDIVKTYLLHEKDGNFNYVDGIFDVTLLGAGRLLGISPARYPDQVHLTGSFYGMRLEE